MGASLKSSGENSKQAKTRKQSDKDVAVSVAPAAKDWEGWA